MRLVKTSRLLEVEEMKDVGDGKTAVNLVQAEKTFKV